MTSKVMEGHSKINSFQHINLATNFDKNYDNVFFLKMNYDFSYFLIFLQP